VNKNCFGGIQSWHTFCDMIAFVPSDLTMSPSVLANHSLLACASTGDLDGVEKAVGQGADDFDSALAYAARYNQVEVMEDILERTKKPLLSPAYEAAREASPQSTDAMRLLRKISLKLKIPIHAMSTNEDGILHLVTIIHDPNGADIVEKEMENMSMNCT